MAINIDTSKPLRRPLDLARLVEAVVQAGPADEAFWIESKSDLDLSHAHGRFKTARAILSFANRMPDMASRTCGGLAYVIVGAEAGNVAGAKVIDAADLDKGLIKYLGGDGPVWSPMYVEILGKNVLVVVEAPKWGDRIYTLRQGYGEALPGTVYIRSQSESRQANPEEFRLLEQRLLRGQQAPQLDGLEVGFTIGMPNAILVIDLTEEQVGAWLEVRRAAIMNWHRAAIAAMEEPNNSLASVLFRPKIDEQRIEEHLQVCRQRLLDATRRILIEGGFSLLTMTITSPGPAILADVELTLTIDTPHSAFEERHVPKDLGALLPAPEPPERRSPLNFGFGATLPFPSWLRIPKVDYHPELRNSKIDIRNDSITLAIGRVRPEKRIASAAFHLFLHERPTDNQLTVIWTLTSTSTQGLQRGTTQLPALPTRGVLPHPTEGLPEEWETDQ